MKGFITRIFATIIGIGSTTAQTFTYDAFNRLTQIAYPDGATITYTYDKLGNRLSAVKSGTGVALAPRVFLQGPYNTGTGKMSDQLRVLGMIPMAEPYTALGLAPLGNSGCALRDSASLFSDKGDNALVEGKHAGSTVFQTTTPCPR